MVFGNYVNVVVMIVRRSHAKNENVKAVNEKSAIALFMMVVKIFNNLRLYVSAVLLISGCATPAVHLSDCVINNSTPREQERTMSDSDLMLTKVTLLLTHAHLDDNTYVSKILGIKLAGGEPESGHGDMIYTCALQSYANMRIWKGRRYRYESAPAYLAPQPFPANSKCFNPYVIDEKNPAYISASLTINLNIEYLCITLADVKRYFGGAYYSQSRGGFSVRYHTGDMDNHISMRIESTRTGKICANTIVLDQNDFSPEFF